MRLFEPGRIGRLDVKNRVIMAAMDTPGIIEPDGRLSQRGIDYYVARARGGAGFIITGASRVTQEFDYSPLMHRVLRVDGSVHTAWLSELADAVHDYGAKIAVQFQAGRGRIGMKKVVGSGVAVAPSAVPCFFDPRVMARELKLDEIERLIRSFELSAEIVRIAGIDAIELNFHAGYLGDEFMTSLWNKRTDRYGGNLENRLRFPTEVIEAVRKGAGAEFPILFKFGLTHYLKGGREIEEGIEIARRIEAAGVAALTIDAGCYETEYWPFPVTYQPPACMAHLAELVKKAVKIPVIAVGRMGYPEAAERVLAEGKADFIALGRPLLADPEWPTKVREGRPEDIRPCLGDNEGCLVRYMDQKIVSCTVNPCAGMERELTLSSAARKKSVLVIGGGPAGMEAARVASLRGHEVTLWEREDMLGGSIIPAGIPDFKRDYRRLSDYLRTQILKVGVAVEFGITATPELVLQKKPEVILVATGATPVIPGIPGIERKGVTAADVLLGRKEIGDRALVLGGGLVGCETALYLKQKGERVLIVEILDSVMRGVFRTNREYLLKELGDVRIVTNGRVLRVGAGGAAITDDRNGRERTEEADTVVIATGFRANHSLFESLKESGAEVHAIGDCVEPGKVIHAIWSGFRTARLI